MLSPESQSVVQRFNQLVVLRLEPIIGQTGVLIEGKVPARIALIWAYWAEMVVVAELKGDEAIRMWVKMAVRQFFTEPKTWDWQAEPGELLAEMGWRLVDLEKKEGFLATWQNSPKEAAWRDGRLRELLLESQPHDETAASIELAGVLDRIDNDLSS